MAHLLPKFHSAAPNNFLILVPLLRTSEKFPEKNTVKVQILTMNQEKEECSCQKVPSPNHISKQCVLVTTFCF